MFLTCQKITNLIRFVCLKQLNSNSDDCQDFEARFCCPKPEKENSPNLLETVTQMHSDFTTSSNFLSTIQQSETIRQTQNYLDKTLFPTSLNELRNFIQI